MTSPDSGSHHRELQFFLENILYHSPAGTARDKYFENVRLEASMGIFSILIELAA